MPDDFLTTLGRNRLNHKEHDMKKLNSRMKILACCPGMRDPIAPLRTDVAFDARTYDAPSRRKDLLRWLQDTTRVLERGATSLEDIKRVCEEGPVLTALLALRSEGWTPGRLWLCYVPSSGEVRDLETRLDCTRRLALRLAEVQGERLDVEFKALDANTPALYNGMVAAMRETLSTAVSDLPGGGVGADLRILVGPGTPQQNFGMMAFAGSRPGTAVMQVMNPRDEIPGGRVLHRLTLDGLELPALSSLGEEVPLVKELRSRVRDLEKLNSALERAQSNHSGDRVVFDEAFRLSDHMAALEKSVVAQAIAETSRRGPVNQTTLATVLGVTRQAMPKILLRVGIDLSHRGNGEEGN